MTAYCPTCHQPLKAEVLGIPMPPLKARIVDLLKSAGDIGLSTQEIRYAIWGNKEQSRHTLKSHMGQIRDLIVATDYEIHQEGRGTHSRWYLIRVYDGQRDLSRSLDEGYRHIRARVAAGGPAWKTK